MHMSEAHDRSDGRERERDQKRGVACVESEAGETLLKLLMMRRASEACASHVLMS